MQVQQRVNARVVGASRQQAIRPAAGVRARVSRDSSVVVEARSIAAVQRSIVSRALAAANTRGSRSLRLVCSAVKDGAALDRPLRVAVIGGGPSGACAAETLAKGGVETFLLERKLDNCKVLLSSCSLHGVLGTVWVQDRSNRSNDCHLHKPHHRDRHCDAACVAMTAALEEFGSSQYGGWSQPGSGPLYQFLTLLKTYSLWRCHAVACRE